MATKKTTAKKSPTKKATSKTASTKSADNAPAGTSTAKKTTRKSAGGSTRKSTQRSGSAPRAESSPRKRTGPALAAQAARQLVELTGRDVEGVTSLARSDDGWRVEVEVLEVRRIPDTTDVLATYELTLDEDGDIEGYRRLHRYVRGTPGEEQR